MPSQYPRIRAASSDPQRTFAFAYYTLVSIPSHSGSLFGRGRILHVPVDVDRVSIPSHSGSLFGQVWERIQRTLSPRLNTLAFGQPLRTSDHWVARSLVVGSQYPRIRAASSDMHLSNAFSVEIKSQYPRIRAASSDLGTESGAPRSCYVSIPSHSGSLFGPVRCSCLWAR